MSTSRLSVLFASLTRVNAVGVASQAKSFCRMDNQASGSVR